MNLSQSYKKEQKSSNRERKSTRKKYELNEINDIKFIQNKMGRRRIKI